MFLQVTQLMYRCCEVRIRNSRNVRRVRINIDAVWNDNVVGITNIGQNKQMIVAHAIFGNDNVGAAGVGFTCIQRLGAVDHSQAQVLSHCVVGTAVGREPYRLGPGCHLWTVALAIIADGPSDGHRLASLCSCVLYVSDVQVGQVVHLKMDGVADQRLALLDGYDLPVVGLSVDQFAIFAVNTIGGVQLAESGFRWLGFTLFPNIDVVIFNLWNGVPCDGDDVVVNNFAIQRGKCVEVAYPDDGG